MTDKQLLDLVLDEGRAFVAHCIAAMSNDHTVGGHRTLSNWHEKRHALRDAVLGRLSAEDPLAVARVRKAMRDDSRYSGPA